MSDNARPAGTARCVFCGSEVQTHKPRWSRFTRALRHKAGLSDCPERRFYVTSGEPS